MTAHGAQGGPATAKSSVIPATPEMQPSNRKPTPPANSAPKQQDEAAIQRPQHQKDPPPQQSSTTQQQERKQQQVRAPEAATASTTSSGATVAAKPSAAEGGKKATATGGDASGDLVGEYVLGETIGKGTFGKVRLGLHLLTGEKVAVKILEKKRIVQVADVERVAREIKILKRNRHRNVIQLYEVIDSPERIFLIMEHVDGGEMFEYIVAHHRIREPEAAFLFRQIVDGLAYLHANEVTHRDLKPENLLLQATHRSALHHTPPQGQQTSASLPSPLLVKIVDFGLSNIHDGGRLLRTACGSPCYAAPEMIQGRLYHGPVADMWSLGVVLFAMVCGFLPFEDSNTNLLYKKILSADYKMPNFLSPNAQDLIRRILETDPEKRYTVDLIRQHAWLAGVPSVEPLELETSVSQTDEASNVHHELVLSQLEELGLSRDDVQAALLKKAHNRLTASYFLLDGKLQRVQKHRAVSVVPTLSKNSTVSSTTITRDMHREGSNTSTNSGGKRPERPEDTALRSTPSNGARHTNAGHAPSAHVTPRHAPPNSPRTHEAMSSTPRRRSTPHHPPPPHQHYGESPYGRRAVTPSSTASPRHTGSVPGSVQRPSSVRGGRNLVLVTAGHALPAGTGSSFLPNPPGGHRHSGVLAPKKPQVSSRVTISNGMVALRPLAQPVYAPRREVLPTTSHQGRRRHTAETGMQQPAPPTHRAVISPSGGTVIGRRPSGAAPPHAHASQQHPAATGSCRVSAESTAKADDTRAPQQPAHRIAAAPSTNAQTQPGHS